MRTKRLLSLVMALFMLFTIAAPTLAWAAEGDDDQTDEVISGENSQQTDPAPASDPEPASEPDPDPAPEADPDPAPATDPDEEPDPGAEADPETEAGPEVEADPETETDPGSDQETDAEDPEQEKLYALTFLIQPKEAEA